MNRGLFRGLGLHALFPNIRGTNPQFPSAVAEIPGNQPSDGNTLRKQTGVEGGFFWSQDYIYVGKSTTDFLLPKGTWDVLLIGGGGAGGGYTSNGGTNSAGGGSATAQIVRARIVADGVTPYMVTIGAGGIGVASAIGNNGGDTTVSGLVLASGLIPSVAGQLKAAGGNGGFAGGSAVVGYGAIPGYPTVAGTGITTAPYASVHYGAGGGLNTTNNVVGQAAAPNAYGCTGGGAGAAINGGGGTFGGNGGAAGGINSGGTVGTGNTGSTTGGNGANAAANTGSGGGGAGGSNAGSPVGGNGGSGWVEFFRKA